METPYTTDELVKLLEMIETPDAPGFTTSELSVACGISNKTARQRIKSMILSGQIELCGKKKVNCIDGRTSMSPAYGKVSNEKDN